MPIVELKITEESPTTPTPTTVQHPDTFKGVVVNEMQTPIAGMKAYLDGMPWQLKAYYRQLLGLHNDLRDLDPVDNIAYQQYEKIHQLELRVESQISPSYDKTTGMTTAVGSAIIVHVVPNENDYFVAGAGMREEGVFRITNVERKTFNENSVYRIDYTLVGFVGRDNTFEENLDVRTIRELYYSKERVASGNPPLLTKKDHHNVLDLYHSQKRIVGDYFQKFLNPTYQTLMIPGQEVIAYDCWIPEFLTAILESVEIPNHKNLRVLSTGGERYLEQPQLWSVLLNRDHGALAYANKEAVLVSRGTFNRSHWLKGARYWTIDYWVYPKAPYLDSRVPGDPLAKPTGETVLTPSLVSVDGLANFLRNQSKVLASTPLIHSVNADGYYVLSKAFYEDSSNLTVLEILLRDYLKRAPVNLELLLELIQAYPEWPALEQFYYGPALILLLKDCTGDFHL